jgi:hypothetical protein
MRNLIIDLQVHIGAHFLKSVAKDPRYFAVWEKHGFHITPVHFYQPIPDTREFNHDLWKRESALIGLDMNEQGQLELMKLFSSQYKGEYTCFPQSTQASPQKFYLYNTSFGVVDAEILYCMIRHFKPARIIEIGSGFTTLLIAESIQKNLDENSNYHCEFVAVEPYPAKFLKSGIPNLTKLISKKVQDVPLTLFKELGENDILFIDSSHTLKLGGDVQYEYLEVIPRLKAGVIVHSHDIFLPVEYPIDFVLDYHWFWTEQYLLQAFLAFNCSFRVMWGAQYMHLKHPDKLDAAFPSHKRPRLLTPLGSFWIRKTK